MSDVNESGEVGARPQFRTGPAAHIPYGLSVPSISTRIKRPEKAAEPEQPVTAAKWGMELPLIPTTLIPGYYNRFAHAAAMTVIDSPGMICNPLLLVGAPGVGKSHFVNFIAYSLAVPGGLSGLLVTDGIRFSRCIDAAVKDGTIGLLDAAMAGVKALIIDDVHLLMLSEANKVYIRKWFGEFVAQGRQLVLASACPPAALACLEEALDFSFTQGWAVDLKTPSPRDYELILSQLARSLEIRIPEQEIVGIFARRDMPMGEAIKILEKMKKLERSSGGALAGVSHAGLLELLLGPAEKKEAVELTDAEARAAAAWRPAAVDAKFKWGIFHPKGLRREAAFALYSLQRRAGELGLNIEWNQVFTEEYVGDGLYSAMFKLGGFARENKVNGALILGPRPSPLPAGQWTGLRSIGLKILESLRIKGAWLPVPELKCGAAYARLLMDLV